MIEFFGRLVILFMSRKKMVDKFPFSLNTSDMKNENEVEGFYQSVAKLLGSEHEYKPFPYRKRTRWNNRTAGNGRFVGFGVVRVYSSSVIHVMLNSPKLNKTFSNYADALEAIGDASI